MTFYWRPGCPFCSALRRRLRSAGVELDERNIWQDPAAAAAVRGITGGDEIVPTVVVAGKGLVNPPAAVVLAALGREPGARVRRPPWRRGQGKQE